MIGTWGRQDSDMNLAWLKIKKSITGTLIAWIRATFFSFYDFLSVN